MTKQDARVKRKLDSWVKPGSNQRRLPEGTVQKLSPRSYLFEEGRLSLDLLFHVKHMEEENVRIFQVKELSYEELTYL